VTGAGSIDAFLEADARYARILAEAEEAKRERDRALLEAHQAGWTMRALAAATNLSLGRVQQIGDRARRHAAAPAP
jgi:hypothetical protein